jgi:hypothetical protein
MAAYARDYGCPQLCGVALGDGESDRPWPDSTRGWSPQAWTSIEGQRLIPATRAFSFHVASYPAAAR